MKNHRENAYLVMLWRCCGTSAIFTGAIASLTPLGRLAKGKVKSMLGVDTKEAKALAEHALSKGVNLNLPSLADENTFLVNY